MTFLTWLACAGGLILIGACVKDLLVWLARLSLLWIGTMLAYRLTVESIPEIGRFLERRDVWSGMLIGGVLGFVVIGVLCSTFIRHMLIRFYLMRSIQRDKDAAKAGRLW